ncbi:hypothetical protein IQ270_25030 [Microcoleus sp. LEGE 07076]|uniref:type II toxin-antitoxin system RelE/ParE family toxin n=1 Tax=Microcoleus sp. LEGE 07076 TaxID=915322 RepID=UPI001881E4B4|nr:type II toxin-antitoxin system RelE/ParE family toxin [Microcoleus sp. LEGE 07076]MBE9187816.1 hypothetical protein [Microcoleus sp. LEGE 07076]
MEKLCDIHAWDVKVDRHEWNQSQSAMLGIADGRSLIYDYFLEQSIDAGDRFVEGFGKKCQYLAEFPYLGRNPFMKSRGISLLLTSKGRSQFLITILPLLKSLEDRIARSME